MIYSTKINQKSIGFNFVGGYNNSRWRWPVKEINIAKTLINKRREKGLLLCGGTVAVMSLLNMIPKVRKYNPIILLGDNTSLLTDVKAAADFIPALVICAALTILLMIASIMVFNRKQL